MKKSFVWLFLCLMLLCAVSAAAQDCPVPEEKLHEAVLALGERMGAGDGEFMAEGHIVLGCEESAEAVDVYASIRYQNYGFMAGIFTDVGGGCGLLPVKMTFAKPEFDLISIQKPNEGMDYGTSIERMLPDALEDRWGGAENDALLVSRMEAQAQAYVQSIGRTEPVMDWRKLDLPLELSGALVTATNALSRFYRYPLWVTYREAVEEGVRYRYEQLWEPDELCDGVTYTLSDGRRDEVSGDTGTLVYRKTRVSDGTVMEEIKAEIMPLQMAVTITHPEGSRCYRLRVCEGQHGVNYALESVTDDGAFELKYEYLAQMDADFGRLETWSAQMREPKAEIVPKAQ